MNTNIANIDTGFAPDEAPKFVLVYEDFESGARAKHFAETLSAKFSDANEYSFSLWRCELLEIPQLAAAAAAEAKECDFVILSMAGASVLSRAMRTWVDAWLEDAASTSCGLIALFDPHRSTPRYSAAARHYLRGVVTSAGVAFFSHCATASNDAGSSSVPPTQASTEHPWHMPHGLTALAA